MKIFKRIIIFTALFSVLIPFLQGVEFLLSPLPIGWYQRWRMSRYKKCSRDLKIGTITMAGWMVNMILKPIWQ